MARYLVYGLIDPRAGQVRYIGKSSSGLRRPMRHGTGADVTSDSYKARWIRGLKAAGLEFGIIVLCASTPESLARDEMAWIAYGRHCHWPLTNLTDGGDGQGRIFSDATRRLMSLRAKGRPKSQAHRAKLAESQRGRKLPPDVRKKMRQSALARTADPTERARLSTLRTGARNSPEAREKLRVANLGLKHSPERRAKNREAQLKWRAEKRTRED